MTPEARPFWTGGDIGHLVLVGVGLAFAIWYVLRLFPEHLERAAKAGAREQARAIAEMLEARLAHLEDNMLRLEHVFRYGFERLGVRLGFGRHVRPRGAPPADLPTDEVEREIDDKR